MTKQEKTAWRLGFAEALKRMPRRKNRSKSYNAGYDAGEKELREGE